MSCFRSLESIHFDSEIEKTLSQIRKENAVVAKQLIDELDKALRDYIMPSINGTILSIQRSAI